MSFTTCKVTYNQVTPPRGLSIIWDTFLSFRSRLFYTVSCELIFALDCVRKLVFLETMVARKASVSFSSKTQRGLFCFASLGIVILAGVIYGIIIGICAALGSFLTEQRDPSKKSTIHYFYFFRFFVKHLDFMTLSTNLSMWCPHCIV